MYLHVFLNMTNMFSHIKLFTIKLFSNKKKIMIQKIRNMDWINSVKLKDPKNAPLD